MGLFKAEFYRTFAIGFALGAVVVFSMMGDSVNPMVGAAVAAPAP